MTTTLSPFVYWAQDETHLYLKIDLVDTKNPTFDVESKSIGFNGSGTGSQGTHEYSFKLPLFEEITTNGQNILDSGHCINITLNKRKPGWWPRLISTPQKPSWLKIDFDKWKSEDDLLDEKVSDIADDYPEVQKHLMRNELGYIKEDFKAVYMVFYNLAMLCGFLYALLILTLTLVKEGLQESTYAKIYPLVGHVLCFIHLFQCLEIMHPIFGYVKGNPLMPFIQIFGRLFILFGNLQLEPRLQKMPSVTWLFVAWIYSDIISGSGIEEPWFDVYAKASVVHMLSGHTFARAVRADLLTQHSLVTLLLEKASIDEPSQERLHTLHAVATRANSVRYVYYIFHTSTSKKTLQRYIYPFTKWLRYSAWIILYPVGFVCESVIIFRNILYLHNEPRFYIRLPNQFNFTFDYLTFLRVYMLFVMFPGMYSLLKHMYKARVKNLGGSEPFDKIGIFKSKMK